MIGQEVMTEEPKVMPQASDHKHLLSARLAAVQALYQVLQNKQPMKTVVKQYIDDGFRLESEGEQLVKPDPGLFRTILFGVDERMLELEAIVVGQLQGDEETDQSVEPLLMAILLCGSYELMAHQDIDFPIIINDYLHVTHAFYEQGEASLVNGVLDAIAATFRA